MALPVRQAPTYKEIKPTVRQLQFLTPRQKEVLACLCQGYTTGETASMLFISYETAKTHRRNLYLKLGVKTGVQLGAVAIHYLK